MVGLYSVNGDPAPSQPAPDEYPKSLSRGAATFTDHDFNRIAAFAHKEFGLALLPTKKDLVYSRLVRRLRTLKLVSFQQYCDLLDGPTAEDEQPHVISALTTNVTHFFREPHHFDLMSSLVVAPQIKALQQHSGRLRIWSAGCSSGMEPFSIAMTLIDLFPTAPDLNIRILATDVDPMIIARAREARFSPDDLRPVPARMKHWAFGPLESGRYPIAPKVADMVHFAELNLVRDWPLHGPLDAIFCRNVAIYFDKPTQARLWSRFAEILAPGGLLFIGHSERISGPAEAVFKSVGTTTYRK